MTQGVQWSLKLGRKEIMMGTVTSKTKQQHGRIVQVVFLVGRKL